MFGEKEYFLQSSDTMKLQNMMMKHWAASGKDIKAAHNLFDRKWSRQSEHFGWIMGLPEGPARDKYASELQKSLEDEYIRWMAWVKNSMDSDEEASAFEAQMEAMRLALSKF